MKNNSLKVWVEIDKKAISNNISEIRRIIGKDVDLFSVVKSNAYGHGIFDFSKAVNDVGVDGFCVDSVIEAVSLRKDGIDKPILVLGPTLDGLFSQAEENNIVLSIASRETLNSLVKSKERPEVHLKIDSGMHRQGFFISEVKEILKIIKKSDINLTGIFSHFASAKDINYPTYTDKQLAEFQRAVEICKEEGFNDLKTHISATGGAMIDKKYHLDLIRSGIGIYGIFPSKELEQQMSDQVNFQPVLSWRALISEVKKVSKGEYVGYDLTKKLDRDTEVAIVPIGYWHGLPWAMSGNGNLLVNGKRAEILGRVSMDLLTIDVTSLDCKAGDIVTIIGKDGDDHIRATDIARSCNTSTYEIITRINPLIKRIVV